MATAAELDNPNYHLVNSSRPPTLVSSLCQHGENHVRLPAESDTEATGHQLPPVDSGPAALRFLFDAFMIEAFQWGKCSPHEPQPLRN